MLSRSGEAALSQAAFDRLLEMLSADRETAGEVYEQVRRKLVKFFEWRGSHFPEDHADETINRVVKRIAQGERINNINAYFLGVARLVFLEMIKRREKEQAALEESVHLSSLEEPEEKDPRLDCFEECLNGLSSDNRDLIVQYYDGERRSKIDKRRLLSESLGIPLNALRIRAHRLREKLEKCILNCAGHEMNP